MALATYSDLLASVATWMDRTDLTATIPDFVALAESRIARDLRLRRQISTASLSTVAGTSSVALPSDFLEIENITLSSTSPPATLSVVTPEILDRKYPAGYQTGQPMVYTILGDNLLLGPTPDGVYTVSMDYYARIAALSVTPTNWLLTNYPSVYLSGALVEAAMYLRSTDDIALFDARYRAEVKQIQDTDDVALRSGSQMRVRVL